MIRILQLLLALSALVLLSAGVAWVLTNFFLSPVEGGPYGDQSSFLEEPPGSPPEGFLNHLGSPASQP